jgi:hypothetical protein
MRSAGWQETAGGPDGFASQPPRCGTPIFHIALIMMAVYPCFLAASLTDGHERRCLWGAAAIDKICHTEKNSCMKLTRVTVDRLILGDVWLFGPADSDDCWGRMMFLPYGRIFGYDNPNEYGWDFKAGTLRLKRKDGEATSVYGKVTMDDGRLSLLGRSLLSPGSFYRLERLEAGSW